MEKRFIFRGNASGVGGHITAPSVAVISVQGASSLPVIGGYSQSTAERISAAGGAVFFDSVRTQATGDFSEKENAYKTLVNSAVKGLNVDRRLHADAVESTLISTHPVNGGEPTIVPTGTNITNLLIDGYPVYVTLDLDLFTKYGTRGSLAKAFGSDDTFYKKYGKRFLTPDNYKPPKPRQIPETGGYVVCSIVSQVRTEHPRIQIDGHILTLDGFGKIFLGELLITSVSRRLTLLRLKLGSPITGEVSCAEVEGNGSIIF